MIEVQSLSKQYGNVRAVDDLTFTVKPGVVTGFLGPNGSGKSTTMRMILGLDNPTSGTATIDGREYRSIKNPLHEVGSLIDAKAVHPNRSAYNHLKWMAQANSIPVSRVKEVLELVGLDSVAKKKAGGFSLGMGQRLGLAGAILGDPKVVILDEPVNGLDPEGIRWVRDFMRRLADQGRTVLVSSHLLSEMSNTADELIVIGRGKLITASSTYDFIKNYAATSVVVRTEHIDAFEQALLDNNLKVRREYDEENRDQLIIPDKDTDEIGALAFTYNIPLSLLSQRRASLEDAFMEITGDTVQYHAKGE